MKIGEKNLIRSNEWIEDNRPLCATCKYAVWGWFNDAFAKRRFVNGCVSTAYKGRIVGVIESRVSDFDPYYQCEAYEKVDDQI